MIVCKLWQNNHIKGLTNKDSSYYCIFASRILWLLYFRYPCQLFRHTNRFTCMHIDIITADHRLGDRLRRQVCKFCLLRKEYAIRSAGRLYFFFTAINFSNMRIRHVWRKYRNDGDSENGLPWYKNVCNRNNAVESHQHHPHSGNVPVEAATRVLSAQDVS